MLMGQVEAENPAGLPCEERPWGLEEILVSVEFQRPRGGREPKQNTGKRDWKCSWEVKTSEIREGRRQVGRREWMPEGSGLERIIE